MATGFKFSELNADKPSRPAGSDNQPLAQVAELSEIDIDFEDDEPHASEATKQKFPPTSAKSATVFVPDDSDILANVSANREKKKRAPQNFADSSADDFAENFSAYQEKNPDENAAAPTDETAEVSRRTTNQTTRIIRRKRDLPINYQDKPDIPITDFGAPTIPITTAIAPEPKTWSQRFGEVVSDVKDKLHHRLHHRLSAPKKDNDQPTQPQISDDTLLDLNFDATTRSDVTAKLRETDRPKTAASSWKTKMFGWAGKLFGKEKKSASIPKIDREETLIANFDDHPTLQIPASATVPEITPTGIDLPPKPANENEWMLSDDALAAAENDILQSLTARGVSSDTAVHAVESFAALDGGKTTASFAKPSLRKKFASILTKAKDKTQGIFSKKKSKSLTDDKSSTEIISPKNFDAAEESASSSEKKNADITLPAKPNLSAETITNLINAPTSSANWDAFDKRLSNDEVDSDDDWATRTSDSTAEKNDDDDEWTTSESSGFSEDGDDEDDEWVTQKNIGSAEKETDDDEWKTSKPEKSEEELDLTDAWKTKKSEKNAARDDAWAKILKRAQEKAANSEDDEWKTTKSAPHDSSDDEWEISKNNRAANENHSDDVQKNIEDYLHSGAQTADATNAEFADGDENENDNYSEAYSDDSSDGNPTSQFSSADATGFFDELPPDAPVDNVSDDGHLDDGASAFLKNIDNYGRGDDFFSAGSEDSQAEADTKNVVHSPFAALLEIIRRYFINAMARLEKYWKPIREKLFQRYEALQKRRQELDEVLRKGDFEFNETLPQAASAEEWAKAEADAAATSASPADADNADDAANKDFFADKEALPDISSMPLNEAAPAPTPVSAASGGDELTNLFGESVEPASPENGDASAGQEKSKPLSRGFFGDIWRKLDSKYALKKNGWLIIDAISIFVIVAASAIICAYFFYYT